MIISDLAIRKWVTVFVLTVILVAAGLFCYVGLPREAAPEVVVPYILVNTSYRGVSAEDIEQVITRPIEEKLRGLNGVKEIVSNSVEGFSSITIEFGTEVDIDKAEQDVKDRVDQAKSELPSDLENDPDVTDINLSEMPVFVVSLYGPCGAAELRRLADHLEERIEGVPGVLDVEVAGGLEREIHVAVDPDRLALYHLPYETLAAAVRSENANVSGGSVRTDEGKYQVRIEGEFESISEARMLVVARSGQNQPVYLRDIAAIEDGFKDQDTDSRVNGLPSVTLYVKKRSGENVPRLIGQVTALLDELEPTFPTGTERTVLRDESEDIHVMISDLENNMVTGLILVVIVVCLAMGLRNALLVSVSIPLSMIISFIFLRMFDITLNMVVLFSLTLALGMLVDNAIVIIENIYRFLGQGMGRAEAARKATAEVAWPIIGSTSTTIAAFLPLLWWSGIMGDFMSYLPKTVITVLLSCLFVALVINPAFASVFMRRPTPQQLRQRRMRQAKDGPIIAAYKGLLRVLLGADRGPAGTGTARDRARLRAASVLPRLLVLVCAMLLLVLGAQFWMARVGYRTPVEFFPEVDPDRAIVTVTMPEGASLAYCNSICREIEKRVCDARVADDPQADIPYDVACSLKTHRDANAVPFQGPSDIPNITTCAVRTDATGGPNEVEFVFLDIKDRIEPSTKTMERISERLKGLAGCEYTVEKPDEGPPTGKPVNVEISGDDLDVLGRIAATVRGLVEQVDFVRNVADDYSEGDPTLKVNVDRKRAGLLGLSTAEIGGVLNAAINGVIVDEYDDGDEEYDIVLRIADQDRNLVDTLERVFLTSQSHGPVPLTSVAEIKYSGGSGGINRIDHRRTVTVSADINPEKTTGTTARAEAAALLAAADLDMPPGYRVRFTGENEEEEESKAFLQVASTVALGLVFFVLVAQFNSVIYPFVVMTSVILSLGGVFLGLAVFELPFGIIMTGVGVISLAGVVVNNAIVLIDYALLLMQRGMSRDDALIGACAIRLRPVLLTAATTILGLVPMVTGVSWDFHPASFGLQTVSESTQWWRSMAVAVMFGLGTATVMTLVVVPTVFSLLDDLVRLLKWSLATTERQLQRFTDWIEGEPSTDEPEPARAVSDPEQT